MSTAVNRFVAARRSARNGVIEPPNGLDPALWNAALRTQRALRGVPAELTMPLWVAREWAVASAGSLEKAIEAAQKNSEISPHFLALFGHYVVSPDRTLGPFNDLRQAKDAQRAAIQHGMTLSRIDVRESFETIIKNL